MSGKRDGGTKVRLTVDGKTVETTLAQLRTLIAKVRKGARVKRARPKEA